MTGFHPRPITPAEVGPVGTVGPDQVRAALALVRDGTIHDLDAGRFPSMPMFDGHPPFQLTSYRTPPGLRVQQDLDVVAGTGNPAGFAFLSELLVASMHTGTHIDALSHITRGDEGWYGGYRCEEYLGDFGPLRADAASIPPIVVPFTLLDVAAYRDVDVLPQHTAIDPDLLAEVEKAQGTPIVEGSAVAVRTGAMSRWPDRFTEVSASGVTEPAARFLVRQRGIVALGADTPTVELMPSEDPNHPHPVHEYCIRQKGVHLLENLWLEGLARSGAHTGCLICLPLKVAGATGSMVRPVVLT